MNLTTDTFNRLEISAPPAGFASPLASAIILAAAALLKITVQLSSTQPAEWPHWALLALFTAAIALNLREIYIRVRRRDWVLILDRPAGRVTFIRVRPVRVRPKVLRLEEISSLELAPKDRAEAEFRYQPRFALKGGKSWHVPDLWGDRARIPEVVEAVNRWLAAGPSSA
jgi:hypothetical protein